MTATDTIPIIPADGGPASPEPPLETSTPSRARSWLSSHWPELLVALGALTLFAWGLDRNGLGNAYYAAAVRSMTQSWHNFFYGSLDPGGWITVDKPPGALWLQALSARVFGFTSWSLLLPSAVCGALAVWFLMSTVSRAWGRTAGIVAGVVLALTPMVVAVSRSNNPDGTLMLTAVLAAWAVQRGMTDGRARWMVLAGVFCGFGFLTKLLAAGLIMPGLWLAYLVVAPVAFRKRVVHCAFGAVAFLGVALMWVGLVDLRPLGDRPWIGGSTDGSALDLVFGYDGFGRLTGASAGPGGGGGGAPGGFGGGGGGGIDQFGGPTGIFRLFNAGMGDQVMWLFPVALVSAVAGFVTAIRTRTRDARFGSLIMWSGWAAVVYVVYAFAGGIFHNYYVSLLAPALAALVGIGAAQALKAKRLGHVVTAVALLASAALEVGLLRRVDAWTWLRVAVPVGVVIAVVVLSVALWSSHVSRRVVVGALVCAGAFLLAAPAAWSLSGVEHAQNGTFPDSRPVSAVGIGGGAPRGGFPGGGAIPGGRAQGADGGAGLGGAGGSGGNAAPGGAGGFGPAGGFGGAGISSAELSWLRSQRHGERWILAVSGASEAETAIIDGDSVVALGGFSGGDNAATPGRVADLVAKGELRYLSVGGGFGGGFGGGGASGLSSAVTSACTAVDASKWDGSGTSGVYDCKGKAAAIRKAGKNAPSGGSGAGTTGPGAQPGGAGGEPNGAAPQQLQTCLAEHGVKIGGNERPQVNDPKFAEAIQACSQYFGGAGGPGGLGGPGATGN